MRARGDALSHQKPRSASRKQKRLRHKILMANDGTSRQKVRTIGAMDKEAIGGGSADMYCMLQGRVQNLCAEQPAA